MSHYNHELIALAITFSYLATLVMFSIVKKLNRSLSHDKKALLISSALIIGSSLWGIQLINAFALPSSSVMQASTSSITYIALSWVAAFIFAAILLYITSRPTLPTKTLSAGGTLAGVSAGAIVFFSIYANHAEAAMTFTPATSLIAIATCIVAAIIGIMLIFWLKNQHGKFSFLAKSMLALMVAFTAIGVHLTYSSAVATSATAENTNIAQFNSSLGLICLFLVGVLITVFYEKFSNNSLGFTKTNAPESLPVAFEAPAVDMSQLALIDSLTQLPNRYALMQHLETATKRSQRNGNSLAVAFIDVDNFKPINDTHGHKVGDEVLQKIAKRLVTAVRGCDEVARIGGDEFIAIIQDVEHDEDCIAIVERMVHSVRESCIINHTEMHLSISVGVAIYPKCGNIDELISAADTAMYRAKKDGKNQFRFFDEEIAMASDQLIEFQYDLRNALANDEFVLHYQMKIDSITRMPIGAEAFLRWQHPIKGLLQPPEFMEAAERFGLSYAINNWVNEECCRTLQELNALGIPFTIAINLSHQQIINPNLVNDMAEMLERFHLPTSSVIFELTEAAAIKNQSLFHAQLARFKAANIKVAIDDFGTQSSSIANLQNLQVSELKLDPTFTANIENNHKIRSIIQAIIELAHVLELNVVAESIETEEQRKILAELGCDHMQGYLFSRPLPRDRLISLLKNLNLRFEDTGVFFSKNIEEAVLSV